MHHPVTIRTQQCKVVDTCFFTRLKQVQRFGMVYINDILPNVTISTKERKATRLTFKLAILRHCLILLFDYKFSVSLSKPVKACEYLTFFSLFNLRLKIRKYYLTRLFRGYPYLHE